MQKIPLFQNLAEDSPLPGNAEALAQLSPESEQAAPWPSPDQQYQASPALQGYIERETSNSIDSNFVIMLSVDRAGSSELRH